MLIVIPVCLFSQELRNVAFRLFERLKGALLTASSCTFEAYDVVCVWKTIRYLKVSLLKGTNR